MSAKSVSPPTGGTSMARRMEPSDGSTRHVTSLCQVFSRPRCPSPWPDREYLRIAFLVRREGMDLERAEQTRKCQMLFGR